MKDNELARCPFCGGEAEIEKQLGDANDGNIKCKECNARSAWFDEYYLMGETAIELATKAWNRRVKSERRGQ